MLSYQANKEFYDSIGISESEQILFDNYNFGIDEEIDEDTFNKFVKDGIIPSEKIENELSEIIKGQTITNYMSLSTFRITFPYKCGKISVDKCDYVDTTDYELIFEGNNYDESKRAFIEFAKENGITYKKSQPKIKRAYDALKRII